MSYYLNMKKLLITALLFVLAACSSGGITGLWKSEDGNYTVDFKSNGELVLNNSDEYDDYSLHYKIDSNDWLIVTSTNERTGAERQTIKSKKTDQISEAMYTDKYYYLEDGTLVFNGIVFKR